MTISIEGHVESTENAGRSGILVKVRCDSSKTVKLIEFYVSKGDAAEWVSGRAVTITAHAYEWKPARGDLP
jgi:hypothetical protein